jgi:hypothetical protein
MTHATDRPAYRPSGRFDPPGLARAVLLLAAVSAGIAAAYAGMIAVEMYFAALAVFVPVLVTASATRSAVKHAHCRNRLLAGALGAACGLAGYLGYFHLDQCRRWGVPWTAIERVPGYVAFRMETDRWEVIGKGAILHPAQPAPGVRPWRPLAGANWRTWNWGEFAFEALALAGVALATGVVSAAEPYSERRRRWCSRESLTLAPEAGPALRQALAEGTVAAWVEARPRKVGGHQPHCAVSVWYTPAEEREEPDLEVFVTIGEKKALALSPEESAAFVQLLPALRDVAGPSLRQLAAEAEQFDDPTSARVWPLPPPYAGQSQNPRNRLRGRWLRRGLTLLPGLMLPLLVGGTYLLGDLAVVRHVLPIWAAVVFAVGGGLSIVVFVRWWFNPHRLIPRVLEVRFDHGLIRQAIAGRPKPLVAADDARAVYAEMSPRRLWSGGKVQCGEYNQGLLLADADRRLLLFEGITTATGSRPPPCWSATSRRCARRARPRRPCGRWCCGSGWAAARGSSRSSRWPTSRGRTTGRRRRPCGGGSSGCAGGTSAARSRPRRATRGTRPSCEPPHTSPKRQRRDTSPKRQRRDNVPALALGARVRALVPDTRAAGSSRTALLIGAHGVS